MTRGGSMSTYIASDLIAELGELHYGRKKLPTRVTRNPRLLRRSAGCAVSSPSVRFSPEEQHAVFAAFNDVITQCHYTCYASAILPDHVHLCIRKHRDQAEDMIANLKFASKQAVQKAGQLPAANHPVWGGPGWKVYLDSVEDIDRTIRYVRQNPIKLGMAPQYFPFETPYDGWPFHKRKGSARP